MTAQHRRPRIVCLSGDSIAPEVMAVATGVLRDLAPDVEVEDMLVDNAAMQLASNPEQFDVIVTETMFGDILSDLAAAMTGGLGLAPSASLGDSGPGIFEPVHGSAPDIAGRGIANPAAMLRSTALMLDHELARPVEARALEAAVDVALRETPTPDPGGSASTAEFAHAVSAALVAQQKSLVTSCHSGC